MSTTFSQIPIGVASVRWCLELCLDAASAYAGGILPPNQRGTWTFIETLLHHPQVVEQCRRLDEKASNYLESLMTDYDTAVFPDRDSEREKSALKKAEKEQKRLETIARKEQQRLAKERKQEQQRDAALLRKQASQYQLFAATEPAFAELAAAC